MNFRELDGEKQTRIVRAYILDMKTKTRMKIKKSIDKKTGHWQISNKRKKNIEV